MYMDDAAQISPVQFVLRFKRRFKSQWKITGCYGLVRSGQCVHGTTARGFGSEGKQDIEDVLTVICRY